MTLLRTSDFDFDLPENLIAQNPASPRDSAKLLVVDGDKVDDVIFSDILDYFNSGDVLVLNRSKVIPARILFDVDGSEKEIFVLSDMGDGRFHCLVRPGKFFGIGKKFLIRNGTHANVLEINEDGSRIIQFDRDFDLDKFGSIPLPPYIKHSTSSDEDYQTVYANELGSVAAPTAGLHFTSDLINKLKSKGVKVVEVILHVGRGTFLPVGCDFVSDHKMHSEFYEISDENCDTLNEAKSLGSRIIAVGTTSVRVLESSFNGKFSSFMGETDIFIYPGNYEWKCVDALITNFHLPKSSLLMLVASFLENKGFKDCIPGTLSLYEHAKDNGYKFYSFGDAMLIL